MLLSQGLLLYVWGFFVCLFLFWGLKKILVTPYLVFFGQSTWEEDNRFISPVTSSLVT